MSFDNDFNAKKHEKFANLIGEFTFGVTHQTFTCDNIVYCFNSHEFSHLVIGYIGGVDKFPVRTHSGSIVELDRSELERLFASAYEGILRQRDIEFAENFKRWKNCSNLDELNKFNPKDNWSYRSIALEAYESASKIKS